MWGLQEPANGASPVPSGEVASHFLHVLGSDQRAAGSRVVLGVLLALLFGALAVVLAGPLGLAAHAGAVLVGLLVGLVSARGVVRRYELSIKSTWSQWMRFAVAAESVAEIHRKVHGRAGRNLPFLYAAILFLAWGLEGTLLVLAFTSAAQSLPLALPVLVLNGLVAGVLAGRGLALGRWFRAFRATVAEMVENGEIGVWGVL